MPPIKYTKLEQMIDKLFRNDLYSYIAVSIENNLMVKVNNSTFNDTGDNVLHRQKCDQCHETIFLKHLILPKMILNSKVFTEIIQDI